MNKEIKFSATLDDSVLTQQIANINAKMKALNSSSAQIQQLQGMSGAGGLPQLSPQVQQGFQAAFKRTQDELKDVYTKQIAELAKAVTQQNSISQALKNQNLELKEQVRLKSELAKADAEVFKIGASAAGAAKAAGIPSPENGKPDMLSRIAKAATGGNIQDMLVALGGSSVVIGAIAKAITVGFQAYQTSTAASTVAASAQGSAVNALYGREVNAMYSGTGQVEASYSAEKLQAMQMAKGRRLGHEIGNMFSMQGVLGALGNEDAQRAQSAILNQQLAADRDQALNGIINQDPFRKSATQQYNANSGNFLQFQRQRGLNFDTFHGAGGFRQQIINGGFSDTLGMEMSNQIMSAGGSTGAGGSKNALLGLQAQRNFNLTNAGNILGKLGATNANPNENREALVRILAEGTKLGFDGSHYVEESRKFTETVADIIAKTGSTSAEAAALQAKSFAGFVANPTTTAGIEGAKNAYQTYQEMSQATTGRQGVLRAAGILTDPVLKKMKPLSQRTLAQLPENLLTPDDPRVIQAAEEAGVSPEELVKRFSEVNRQSMSGGLKGVTELQTRRQTLLKSNFGKMSDTERASTLDKIKSLDRQIGTSLDYAAPGIRNAEGVNALMQKYNTGATETLGPAVPKDMQALKDKLETQGKTGRIEDQTQQNEAIVANEMLKSFRENKDTIVLTTEAMRNFTAALRENMELTKQGKGNLSGTGLYTAAVGAGVRGAIDPMSYAKDIVATELSWLQEHVGTPSKK